MRTFNRARTSDNPRRYLMESKPLMFHLGYFRTRYAAILLSAIEN